MTGSFDPDETGREYGDDPPADASPAQGASEDKKSRAQATQLMKLVFDGRDAGQPETELFHASDGEPYVYVPVGEHFETWPIASVGFRDWLHLRYYRRFGKPLPEHALKEALATFSAIARFDGKTHPVHVRVANHGGHIYVDLADSEWRVVDVGLGAWHIVTDSPVRFRRARGMLALPQPERGGSVEELRTFLNVSDASWPLVLSWLIMAFRGRGPFPVIVLTGEQGSGKTTAARVLRSLLDPSASPDRAEPREERDLAIAARNSYAVVIDNLSRLPRWLSDAFSRLSIGAGLSTRQLFTDTDEVFFFAARPIALNGISEFVQRSDLLDRSLLIELQNIPESKRRTEEEFWKEFDAARPRILGALLSVVAVALEREQEVHLAESPRMADFVRWLTAAEPGLGWPAGSFLTAYQSNRGTAHALALDASVIVPPLVKITVPWEGTAAELLEALAANVDPSVLRQEGWPKGPRALGAALRALTPNLRTAGIEVSFERESHTRRRLIRVTKLASPPSPDDGGLAGEDGHRRPAPASPASPFASPTTSTPVAAERPGDAGDASFPPAEVATWPPDYRTWYLDTVDFAVRRGMERTEAERVALADIRSQLEQVRSQDPAPEATL